MGGSSALLLLVAGVTISALFAALVLLAAAHRALANRTSRRRERVEADIRLLLTRVVVDGDFDLNLLRATRTRGRAIDRLAAEQLPKLKGEGRQHLSALLDRRNVLVRARRSTRSRGPTRRASAAYLLGTIGGAESLPVLQKLLLDDPDAEVRIVAARALGHLGDPRAVAPLVLALEQELVPPGITSAALLAVGETAVDGLRTVLRGPGPRTRALAAELLGVFGAIPAVPDLLGTLRDRDSEVRIAAARALGRIAAPAAVPALVECLAVSEPPALRAVAAKALGQLGAIDAVDDLAVLLGDTDHWTAHNAAQALAAISADGRGLLEERGARDGPGADHAREALAGAHLRGRDGSTFLRRSAPDVSGRAPHLDDLALAGVRR